MEASCPGEGTLEAVPAWVAALPWADAPAQAVGFVLVVLEVLSQGHLVPPVLLGHQGHHACCLAHQVDLAWAVDQALHPVASDLGAREAFGQSHQGALGLEGVHLKVKLQADPKEVAEQVPHRPMYQKKLE